MAINPATPVYAAYEQKPYMAVVDVDISGAPTTDPNAIVAKALVTYPSAGSSPTTPTYTASPIGASNLATGQVAVVPAGVAIAAARATRREIVVTNLGTTDVWLGPPGVTVGNGDLLPGVKGAARTYAFAGALSAIVAAGGSQSVSFSELY